MNKTIWAGIIILATQSFVKAQEIDPNDLDSLAEVYPQLKFIAPSARATIAKDPWRQVGGETNFIFDKGWVEFQGEAIEERGDFTIFKGKFGNIGNVSSDIQGVVRKTDYSSTSSSDSNDKLNGNYNSSGDANNNTRSSSRQFTNGVNKYSQNGGLNSSVNDRYNTAAKTTVRQQRSASEIVTEKALKSLGEDLYLVVNFPFPLDKKREFEKLIAKRSGYQTYTNENGRKVTLRKLDYGTPCDKIWTQAELDVIKEMREAPLREAARLRAEAVKRKLDIEAADLKRDIDMAESGNTASLRRMGERYRNGIGVEKDEIKANKYFARADELFAADVKRVDKKKIADEQAALMAKFQSSLAMANKSVDAARYVEKCYRLGIGTEIDTKKADEYHDIGETLNNGVSPTKRF